MTDAHPAPRRHRTKPQEDVEGASRLHWIALVLRGVCRPIQAIQKLEAEERGAVIIGIPYGLVALFALG